MKKPYNKKQIDQIMDRLSKSYTKESLIYLEVANALNKFNAIELDSLWAMVITTIPKGKECTCGRVPCTCE